MYKFKSHLMSVLAVAGMAFLTSCGNDEEVNPKANITFNPSGDAVTAEPGETLMLQVNVTSEDNLKEFKAEKTALGTTQNITTVTNFPNAGYTYNLNETVPTDATIGNIITYTFTATTRNNEVTTKTYTVTVGTGMVTFSAKILGNQNAAAGSFFNSTTGAVLNSTDAKNNQASVDFLYYYSVGGSLATNKATIVSPDQTDAAEIFGPTTTAAVGTWTVRNTTMFKGGLASPTFTSADSGMDIEAAYDAATATPAGRITDLQQGQVFAFMTEDGRHGLAKVVSVTIPTAVATASEIKLDIKVQD